MRSKLAICVLIGLAAVGCTRRPSDRGLGAGADSGALRDSRPSPDTTMASPAQGAPGTGSDTTSAKSPTRRDSVPR